MTLLTFDGSFEGLFTCIFEVYERRLAEVHIQKEGVLQANLLSDTLTVESDTVKANRVWAGLKKKLSPEGLKALYRCYLSEQNGVADIILLYTRHVFANRLNVETDYGHPAVLKIAQINKQVRREKHRMEAFVRFQLLKDGFFYAGIEPDFNVLPLIMPHFKSRYADQSWLIYDIKRRYGIYYDHHTEETKETVIEWNEGIAAGALQHELLDEQEPLCQMLWKDYFKSTGIPERRNMKLHVRHIPYRYWKHLTEKL
jgi:probable DNA metabolism protein